MRLALLWCVGFAARVTLLAVPPLIPTMHGDLVLDETAVGALAAIPIVLLSAGSVGGSLVISRVGPRRAAILGLAVVALAGAARVIGPSVPWLFAMTIVMGAGVALTQVAMPSLVAAWEGHNVGRATAVYGNGMLLGEIAGAALTTTVVLSLVGGVWERALALWSVPVLVISVALVFQPEPPRPPEPPRWWPDWQDRRVWLLGLTLGAASLSYWGSNAHLPDYLDATGHGADVAPALASLNIVQLPSSFLVAFWPALFVARRWPFVAAGLVTTGAALGLIATGGAWAPAWAGSLGLVSALVFVLVLALPPLMAAPGDVHRITASVFTISYACAFIGPIVAGALWDATHVPLTALLPVAAAGIALMLVGSRLHPRRPTTQVAPISPPF